MKFINWHGHDSVMAYTDAKLEKEPEFINIQGKEYRILDITPQPLASSPQFKYVYVVTIEEPKATPYK